MNKQTLPILIAIVIVILVAAWLFTRNTDTKVANNSDQTNSQSNISNNTNTNPTLTPTPSQSMDPIDIKNKFVTLTVTGYGDIKLELFDEDAPKAVENFIRLAQSGYYNGVSFHRVIPGFVVQGGDPTGTGRGGESAFGGDFADELDPNTPSYKTGYVKGVLAMANKGPNTNSSQFFITLADQNANLQKLYTIFGKVVSGMDVVEKIGAKGTPAGQPQEQITIEKAVVTDK